MKVQWIFVRIIFRRGRWVMVNGHRNHSRMLKTESEKRGADDRRIIFRNSHLGNENSVLSAAFGNKTWNGLL